MGAPWLKLKDLASLRSKRFAIKLVRQCERFALRRLSSSRVARFD
jgi:hypothetical protein